MLVSVCIPCYRSAKTLPAVVKEIREAFAKHEGYDYQLVLVCDGSPDDTYDVICALCKDDPHIIGVELSRNYGQAAAKQAALAYAQGDAVVYMDDDGQHPAEGIFPMLEKLAEGCDVVYAQFPQKHHSWFKRTCSKLYQTVSAWMGNRPRDIAVSSFTAWDRMAVEAAKKYHSPFPAAGLYLNRITTRIANVPMEHRDRLVGKSNYSLKSLMALTVTALTNFSIVPLRMASVVGVLTAVFGFLVAVVMVIRKLLNANIAAGYTTSIAVQCFIGGVIMMMLGILGEYVGRIFMTVSDLPQYTVRRTENAPRAEKKEDKA